MLSGEQLTGALGSEHNNTLHVMETITSLKLHSRTDMMGKCLHTRK